MICYISLFTSKQKYNPIVAHDPAVEDHCRMVQNQWAKIQTETDTRTEKVSYGGQAD